MKTSPIFRRALQAILPATLLLTACGKDDDPVVATPDQGRIVISHAAAAANTQVTAFANDVQIGQFNYGQTGSYTSVNTGNVTVRVNNGTQPVATQAVAVAKDQNYTVFAYSPAATIGSVAIRAFSDDLTTPASGQAKVRLVHLGVGAPNPVRLTLPSVIPGAAGTDITSDVAFEAASGFTALNAGSYNLSITSAAAAGGTIRTQVLAVGDGSGTGTGTKTYEAGKIYTIVVRGIAGSGVPTAQQSQAAIIQHN